MNTTISKSLFAVAVAVAMAGCATVAVDDQSPASVVARAELIPATVSARPWGRNYEISGLVEDAKGNRALVLTYATHCQVGRGDIFIGEPGDGRLKNVMDTGKTSADQMFAQLCAIGLPLTEKKIARRRAQ